MGENSRDIMNCTPIQTDAWLRGLLSVALADDNFSPKEKDFFQELLSSQHLENDHPDRFSVISPAELAAAFGKDDALAQNFLRTAVMMAMVDGEYSDSEDKLIHEYASALGQEIKEMTELRAHFTNPSKSIKTFSLPLKIGSITWKLKNNV